jgi:hypothetical protein
VERDQQSGPECVSELVILELVHSVGWGRSYPWVCERGAVFDELNLELGATLELIEDRLELAVVEDLC